MHTVNYYFLEQASRVKDSIYRVDILDILAFTGEVFARKSPVSHDCKALSS